MTDTTQAALRKQFEDAYVTAYPTSSMLDQAQFHREDDGQYERVQVQTAWTLYCAALAAQAVPAVTYHQDDEGPEAVEAYGLMAACVDEKTLKSLSNWIAHGARATMGGGRIVLTRRDWSENREVRFLPLAASPAPAEARCEHRIADIRNPIVKSGYMCVDCGALFRAADHDAAPAEAKEERISLFGAVSITGPAEDVAFVMKHLPDVDDPQPQAAQPVAYMASRDGSLVKNEHLWTMDNPAKFDTPLYTAAPAPTEEQEREAFEEWAESEDFDLSVSWGSQQYTDGATLLAWDAWKSRAALRSTQGGE